ncbi:DUF2164 domain-containing protein [Bacillus sp. V59.32b]|uniref:DUF2164 domain-containing protein n=1 Tax=Bacillus sp. V59.32b TaxID=1758642 RepID=UPI000E3CA704|nr:DUF2164 domain-containing protein [Bacillus sp. V59.32b]RFU63171.1 DUF2164 domain-containing protein [Bacillus sp. V59.32b]
MFLKFSLAQKTAMIRSIQDYIYRETGEEIGELAAENHLEFILEDIAPFIYNKGIQDAKAVVEDRIMIMDEDLASLERPIK